MLTENIKLIPFKNKINSNYIKKKLKIILNEDNEVLKSLGKNYQSSFKKLSLSKYYKFNNFRIIEKPNVLTFLKTRKYFKKCLIVSLLEPYWSHIANLGANQ